MSNPDDPRYPSTGPGPHPPQPQLHYPPPGHYPPQQPYPPYAQPYPGQHQPYPYQYGPARTFTTSAGAVIGLGAVGGALAYLFVGIPVGLVFDLLAFKVSPDLLLRGLMSPLPKIGVPSGVFFLVYSALLGALVGALRLGIRNAAAMIGAGILFGLLVRTGLGLAAIAPLLSGQVRLNFPLLAWAKTLLTNGLWGLGVAAFLVMTTRR